jgi:hypothetical protein
MYLAISLSVRKIPSLFQTQSSKDANFWQVGQCTGGGWQGRDGYISIAPSDASHPNNTLQCLSTTCTLTRSSVLYCCVASRCDAMRLQTLMGETADQASRILLTVRLRELTRCINHLSCLQTCYHLSRYLLHLSTSRSSFSRSAHHSLHNDHSTFHTHPLSFPVLDTISIRSLHIRTSGSGSKPWH